MLKKYRIKIGTFPGLFCCPYCLFYCYIYVNLKFLIIFKNVLSIDNFPEYDVINVPADGNCIFSALCLQLGRPLEDANSIRQELVDYMRACPVSLLKDSSHPINEQMNLMEIHTCQRVNENSLSTMNTEHPQCWNDEQLRYFLNEYTWIFFNSGKLGCTICRDVYKDANCKSDVAGSLSLGWVEGTVAVYGENKSKQNASLRRKLYKHKNSKNHCYATELLSKREKESLRSSVTLQQEHKFDECCKIFRTAYYVAKSDRPYSDHTSLLELQELNGVSVGRLLHSNVSCVNITEHIAHEMRHTLVNQILSNKCHVSVLVDESTNISRTSCLIVYIRATLDQEVGPVTFFLDIVELSSTTADSIELALLQCLASHGFTNEYLTQHFIGLGIDGASVMLGNRTGLATKLRSRFPLVIPWHCFNHRLELSVHDAVKCCNEINNFKSFMDLLYSTYSMSPKCMRELAECAKDLEVQLTRIGRVLGVRWVASSFRSVKAVWNSYTALHTHFLEKSQDTSLDAKERAKFSGMSHKLENPVFVKNLGLMYDALEELSDLSLALQKADITLPVANRLITRQIEVFNARRETDSHFYSQACTQLMTGSFNNVKMSTASGKEREIIKSQFYQSLADNMSQRLLPEGEKDFCTAVAILDLHTWPSELTAEYGETELRVLCSRFSQNFSEVKVAYREFRNNGGHYMPNELKKLVNCINCIPVSTAECERGFSKMNILCSPLRSRITVKHLSSLMFLSLCGPPLRIWHPLPYVKSWIASGKRDANCTQAPSQKPKVDYDKKLESLWGVINP